MKVQDDLRGFDDFLKESPSEGDTDSNSLPPVLTLCPSAANEGRQHPSKPAQPLPPTSDHCPASKQEVGLYDPFYGARLSLSPELRRAPRRDVREMPPTLEEDVLGLGFEWPEGRATATNTSECGNSSSLFALNVDQESNSSYDQKLGPSVPLYPHPIHYVWSAEALKSCM